MFTMTAELISVASLILMFVVLCCVVKMYSAVMAVDYERRQGFPVQGPEMEGQERAGREADDRRLRGQRGRLGTNQRTGRRLIPREHDERRC